MNMVFETLLTDSQTETFRYLPEIQESRCCSEEAATALVVEGQVSPAVATWQRSKEMRQKGILAAVADPKLGFSIA